MLLYLGLFKSLHIKKIIWKIGVMSQYDCIDWGDMINRSSLIFMLI